MSATNRGAKRNAEDFYPTSHWATHALLENCELLQQSDKGYWCEPAAGNGDIIAAVESFGIKPSHWQAVDIRKECQKPLERLNIERSRLTVSTGTIYQMWAPPMVQDVIITNPPYSAAEAFIERAINQSAVVAMLLRLNFIGSVQREALFERYEPDLYPIYPRPFPDATEYAWFVWSAAGGGRFKRIKGRKP